MKAIAHIASIFVGSLCIMSGVETIVFGTEGFVGGILKWMGGILIFSLIALLSLPIGLGLRYIVGLLPVNRLAGAIFGGILVSLIAAYVLHPGMNPTISLSTHLRPLLAMHIIAGILGGATWWFVEFKFSGMRLEG